MSRLSAVKSPQVEIMKTPIDGCLVIKFPSFEDERGSFSEIYNYGLFAGMGLPCDWLQDNLSYSHAKVLRGLHFQEKNPQGKLMRCVEGAILDVCVDMRPESPSFKEVYTEILSENKVMYLPPGTAHGFCVLSDGAWVHYKCTTLYDKDSEAGILWNDPDLGIEWPWKNPLVSAKDQALPKLIDYLNPAL